MRKNLAAILAATLIFCAISERAAAQFGGEGAFGSIVNYLKRVGTNVIPSVTDTYDLGSAAKEWDDIYGKTFYESGAAIGGLYFKLDQTVPQTVDLGIPIFHDGITLGGAAHPIGMFSVNLPASQKIFIDAYTIPHLVGNDGVLDILHTPNVSGAATIQIQNYPMDTTGGFANYGIDLDMSESGARVITAGSPTEIGISSNVAHSSTDTSVGTYTIKAFDGAASNTGSTDAGTKLTYGGYFSGIGDAAGTSTAYGIYASAAGADTNWAGYFSGNISVTGNVDGGIVRTNNYQNAGGTESLIWAAVDDWWELSNDLKLASGNLAIGTTFMQDLTVGGDMTLSDTNPNIVFRNSGDNTAICLHSNVDGANDPWGVWQFWLGTDIGGLNSFAVGLGGVPPIWGDNSGNVYFTQTLTANNLTTIGTGSFGSLDIGGNVDLDSLQNTQYVWVGNTYATIQAAIDSIGDEAADKIYTVMVPTGVYDEKIVMAPYINVVGVDRDGSIIKPSAVSDGDDIVTAASNSILSNISVKCATYVGSPGAPTGDYDGVSFTALTNSYLSNVYIDISAAAAASNYAVNILGGSPTIDGVETPDYIQTAQSGGVDPTPTIINSHFGNTSFVALDKASKISHNVFDVLGSAATLANFAQIDHCDIRAKSTFGGDVILNFCNFISTASGDEAVYVNGTDVTTTTIFRNCSFKALDTYSVYTGQGYSRFENCVFQGGTNSTGLYIYHHSDGTEVYNCAILKNGTEADAIDGDGAGGALTLRDSYLNGTIGNLTQAAGNTYTINSDLTIGDIQLNGGDLTGPIAASLDLQAGTPTADPSNGNDVNVNASDALVTGDATSGNGGSIVLTAGEGASVGTPGPTNKGGSFTVNLGTCVSTPGAANGIGRITLNDATSSTTVKDVFALRRTYAGGAGDNNMGTGLIFETEDASSNIEEVGNIDVLNTTAAHATQVGEMRFGIMGTNQIGLRDGAFIPITTNDVDLGTSSLLFKDLYLSGDITVNGDDIKCDGDLTLDPAGNDVILDNANLQIQQGYALKYTGTGNQGFLYTFNNDADTGVVFNNGSGEQDYYYMWNGSATYGMSWGAFFYNVSVIPWGTGLHNSGNASNYWADISYKTLTDRGCLGSFDNGVELQDGTIVSDTEAIKAIKVHPTKKTIYGAPMLDYRTFPKVSYKPADKDGELLPRDENDEPIGGTDGVEMTSFISILTGSIKELDQRISILETENRELKQRVAILEAAIGK